MGAALALGGASIAYVQMKIAAEKFRLDLLKERATFVDSVIQCAEHMLDDQFDECVRKYQSLFHLGMATVTPEAAKQSERVILYCKGFRRTHELILNQKNKTKEAIETNEVFYKMDIASKIANELNVFEELVREYFLPIETPRVNRGDVIAPVLFIIGLFVVPASLTFAMWCAG